MNPESGKQPFFSIVTACLNSAATLPCCLQSLFAQSYDTFELIVIDGKSSDCTLQIVDDYAQKLKNRCIQVTVRSERDHGIYDAINKGIGLCSGEVVGILNSDDYYDPKALENVSKGFSENHKADIVYGMLRQWKNGQELGVYRYNYDYILSSLESGIESAAQHPACFVRRSVYESIGCYDTAFPIAADYDFLLRAKRDNIGFTPVDAVLSNFDLGGASSQVDMVTRLEQRWRAQHKNGLLSDGEYRKKQLQLARMRFGNWRRRMVQRLLHPFG